MHSRHNRGRKRGIQKFAATLRDPKIAPQQGLGGRSAQAYDYLGLERGDFGFEPRATGVHFFRAWFFVDAAFPAWLPFEMLDGICQVDPFAVDTRGEEGFVQEFSGRADERFSLEILLIARLFADHHDLCAR